MKSIVSLPFSARVRRATAGFGAVVLIAACGGGGSGLAAGPMPQPVRGDVERAQFDPSLHINLAAMSRRPDGLYVQDLKTGTGTVATVGRTVVVQYTGWLPNGTQFDTGEISVTLGSNKTIPAWEEGLLGIRVGGIRRLVVPAALGYGANASGPIPANSVLVFQMQALSVLAG